ncbi:MAG: putative porin, partial [Chthoniobacterales bacterium]
WDGDLNPEGLAEQYKHTFNLSFGGGSTASAATSDGKGMAMVSAEPYKMSIEVFANFGQFVYDDQNPENPIGNPAVANGRRVPENDAYLLGWQIGAKFNFTKDIYFKVAPTLYNYTGYGNDFNTFYNGGPSFIDPVTGATVTTNQTGINSLLIYDMPAEFGFKVGELPVRVFSDFAVNLDAEDRARASGRPDKGGERYAYQIGAGIGQLKAKHDWQLQAFWQHAEQYSLDPNLVDSDIFDSRLNMEGVALQAGYAISDAVTFNLTYAYGEQIDHTLGTAGIGDIGVNPLREYQLFQADLNFKF